MRRRSLLLAGAGAGGVLLVGWSVLPPRSRLGRALAQADAEGRIALNGWIRIAPDGQVVLAMNRSEMGQGVHTALAMLVAEELDMPLARVGLVDAGSEAIYGNVAALVGSLPSQPRDVEPGADPLLGRRAGTARSCRRGRGRPAEPVGRPADVAAARTVASPRRPPRSRPRCRRCSAGPGATWGRATAT